MCKRLKRAIHSICALLLVSAFAVLQPPVFADDFPGKGDRFAWSNALPYYNLANKYLEHGRIEEAVQNYEEAIYRYEYDPDFFVNYGVALRKRENYTGAEVAFKKAIELRANDWESWSNLANAYLKQNKLKETVETFQKTLKVLPAPPLSQRQAIEKDIADIKKIMSMQAKPGSAAAAAPGQSATSSKPGTAAKPGAAAKPGTAAKPGAAAGAAGMKQSAKPLSPAQLSKSGWDWVN